MNNLRRNLGIRLPVKALRQLLHPRDKRILAQAQQLAAFLSFHGYRFSHYDSGAPLPIKDIPIDQRICHLSFSGG